MKMPMCVVNNLQGHKKAATCPIAASGALGLGSVSLGFEPEKPAFKVGGRAFDSKEAPAKLARDGSRGEAARKRITDQIAGPREKLDEECRQGRRESCGVNGEPFRLGGAYVGVVAGCILSEENPRRDAAAVVLGEASGEMVTGRSTGSGLSSGGHQRLLRAAL